MPNYSFYRAQPLFNVDAINVTIKISLDLKPDVLTLNELADIYKKEGKELADILFKSLPGGTVDMLLKSMLERRASLLVIPFIDN